MARRQAVGFTLLEVTLARVALALVTAVCYGAFHLGMRAVERGEVAVVTAQRLRVATDTLIRQLKSTVAYPARNRDEDIYPFFVGTATSMTFISANGLHGGGGLARVVYQVADDPPRLLVAESGFFSPDALGRQPLDWEGLQGAVLLDGFRALRFEYMLDDGVDTEWRPQWDGLEEEALPAAVRVVAEGVGGVDGALWGQEIPIMATMYGENMGEVGDEDLPEGIDSLEWDEEEDRPSSRNWTPSPPPGSDHDDEDDE